MRRRTPVTVDRHVRSAACQSAASFFASPPAEGPLVFRVVVDAKEAAEERLMALAAELGECEAQLPQLQVSNEEVDVYEYRHQMQHAEATLERLGISCIDLYMVHWPIDANSMAHFAGAHT